MQDSFGARGSFEVDGQSYKIARLSSVEARGYDLARLPYALRILLENLLRHEDGESVTAADIEAVAGWDPGAKPSQEIAFRPARVLMQDFTGVPAVVDLAAMRDAMEALGGDPTKINPLQPAELVIDHSVQVDAYGTADAIDGLNVRRQDLQARLTSGIGTATDAYEYCRFNWWMRDQFVTVDVFNQLGE